MAPFLWACLSKYCQPHSSLKGVQPLLPVRPHPICELLGGDELRLKPAFLKEQ